MSGGRTGWVLPVLVALAVGLLAFVVYTVAFADGEEDEDRAEAAAAERDDERRRALEEKRRQLQQLLATKRPPSRSEDLPRRPREPRPRNEGEDEPQPLTPRQKVALKAALDGFYSPADLAQALRDRTAPHYAREVNQKYQELVIAENIENAQGAVPITADVRLVIKRLNVVAGYAQNMLHTLRPDGQEHLQQQMIERINTSFGKRFDQLNQDYPFLNVQTVDSL